MTSFKSAALWLVLLTAVLTFFMYYAFIPGRYDGFAEPLSFVIQIFALIGTILLFPVCGLWFLYELVSKSPGKSFSKYFGIVTLFFCFIVAISVLFAAHSKNFFLLGLLLFVLICHLTYRQFKNYKTDRSKIKYTLFYLMLLPLLLLTVRFIGISKAVAFSMNTAIQNSEIMISKIENYKLKHGHYPTSLAAEWNDFPPKMTGIEKFYYESFGDSYNLFFEQFSDELDILQFVMYNPLDQHHFTCHDTDLLEYTGDELDLRRGDRHRYKLSQAHWLYYKLD